MPYCVKCGVELDKSAKKCVLCQTEVHFEVEKEEPPYPREKDEIDNINVKYLAFFLSILLLIPNFAVLVINLIYYSGIYWMYYVFGASLVIWMIFIFPMVLERKRPILHIFLIFLSITLYVYLISLAVDGLRWFLIIALPILLTIMILMFSIIFIRKKKKIGRLKTTSVSLTALIILCLVIEGFIDYYINSQIVLAWSYIVAASLIPIIIALMILSGNKKLQEDLSKKLHI